MLRLDHSLAVASVAAAFLLACGDDAATGTSSSGGAGADGGAAGAGNSGNTGNVAVGGTGNTANGGMGGAGNSSAGGMGAMGGGGICDPDVNDGACEACLKDSCCTEATACEADAECGACLSCLEGTPDITTCAGDGSCQLMDAETSALAQCGYANCQADCVGGGMGGAGGGGNCPPNANDGPCVECAKMDCCPELSACIFDQECAVCLNCINNTGSIAQCEEQGDCDLQDVETGAVSQCTTDNCSAQCFAPAN